MTVTAHRLTLDPRAPGAPFHGTCSCGAVSGRCTASGQVHGWHAGHIAAIDRQEVDDLVDEAAYREGLYVFALALCLIILGAGFAAWAVTVL